VLGDLRDRQGVRLDGEDGEVGLVGVPGARELLLLGDERPRGAGAEALEPG
jgi:hypothetical protein